MRDLLFRTVVAGHDDNQLGDIGGSRSTKHGGHDEVRVRDVRDKRVELPCDIRRGQLVPVGAKGGGAPASVGYTVLVSTKILFDVDWRSLSTAAKLS